jgi:hypothetical protein
MLIGQDFLGSRASRATEKVAQRLSDRRRGRTIELTLVVAESEL